MDQLRPLTLDSSVFFSQIKGDETYSRRCGSLISRVGLDFFLVEPAIVLAEVGNAVGRNVDLKTAEDEVDGLVDGEPHHALRQGAVRKGRPDRG